MQDLAQETSPDTALRAVHLALFFASIKLAVHIAVNAYGAHLGWGYFRDEFYYIACGQHLDWGYVDHGPIVALQARLALLLFGKSLVGIRMLSALAGAAKVFLTGIIAWQMGARRAGQALAMAGVLLAPNFLALDSFLSMNSFEPVFWMTAVFAVLRLLDGGNARWWIVFGLAGGIGMENKPSMLVFLVALLIGLLLTPQRRILASRMMLVGVVIAGLLMVPNVLWQVHHHWPTLEFVHNGKVAGKNVKLPPLDFLLAQIVTLSPATLPLWSAGLVWLLRSPRFRFAGFTYLVFLLMMMATGDAKDYYLAPIYPLLFAAGGCAWQGLLQSSRTRWIVPAYAALLAVATTLVSPLVLPVLRPQKWIAYTAAMHLVSKNEESEKLGPFPQLLADRFGWQEMTDDVTRIYRALPAADQAKAGILCSNYGEAGALDFLGADRGLPPAISGHNNYYLWGPHGATGEVMIVINGATPAEMLENYSAVEVVGKMDHPYAMPFEHRNIYLARGRKSSLVTGWSELKHYY
jgi:4-amino-4-deoxy-L-arabinose transferase-like glycosyltransferase